MATFTDSSGNQWQLRVDVDTIRKCRRDTGYDLSKIFTESGMVTLRDDVVLLVDVLWSMCESQAVARQVSAFDFGRSLVGDAIEAAGAALLDASIDFLPQARREVMTALMGKVNEVIPAANQAILTAIQKIDVGKALESSGPS